MKKYLVSGGAGFIGCNYIKYLLGQKLPLEIAVVDNLTYAGNLKNLEEEIRNKQITFHQADITDQKAMENIFQQFQPDFVINFAAETHVDRSISFPDIFVKTNVLGTQILIEEAKKIWQNGQDKEGYPTYRTGVKYLQISTDEVYGTVREGEGGFTEKTNLEPRSPYGASKAAADLLVQAYFTTFHLPINITRCSNNYGPFQHEEKLIPLLFTKIKNGQKVPVYGDGQQIRDWIYVEDHCRAVELVLQQGKLGEVYNIGGNNQKKNIDSIKHIIELSSADDSIIQFVTDRLGHDRHYAIDDRKIRQELSFELQTSFDAGLKKALNHYLESK